MKKKEPKMLTMEEIRKRVKFTPPKDKPVKVTPPTDEQIDDILDR